MSRAINRFRHLLMILIVLIGALIPLSACDVVVTTQTPEPSVTPTPTSEGDAPEPTATPLLEEFRVERTLVPTATPGPLQQEVIRRLARSGLSRTQFLGITISDWVNLLLSLIFVILGYIIGTWIIRSGYRRAVRRAPNFSSAASFLP